MEPPKPSRNWVKFTCLGCVFAPCLLSFVTFGYLKYRVSKQGDGLPIVLAELRKMGVPTEPSDLAQKPAVPDSDNAAPYYQQLASIRKTMSDTSVLQGYSGLAGHPDDRFEAKQQLDNAAPALKVIDEAVKRNGCDFARDYSKGANLLFPEYADMKGAVKLLGGRAKFQWEAGNYSGAIKSIGGMLRVARHCSSEPTLIGELVCFADYSIAMVAIDQLLEVIKNKPTALKELDATLTREWIKPRIVHAFHGEVVMSRFTIESLRSWHDFMPDSGSGSGGFDKTIDRLTLGDPAVRRMLETKYLELWKNAFAKFPKDESDWRGYQTTMQEIEHQIEMDNSIEGKLNQIMFPVFDQFTNAWAAMMAKQRLSLLATKLLEKRATSKLPSSLKEFGDLAIDPFTRKNMRYDQNGKGFKVWSVGQNETDENGLKYLPNSSMRADDCDIVLGYDIGLPTAPPKRAYRPATPSRPGFGAPSIQ